MIATLGGRVRRHPVAIVLAGWGAIALALVAASWEAIAGRQFIDADDAMRLLEVRDWLAGQSWFDVAQHRLNRGDFPMHWSRLVDLPLAGTMALLHPLLGTARAETVALVAVPLMTLLAVIALVALVTRRLAGRALVPQAVLLVALAAGLLFQFRPLRIDHHGWQIAAALAAVAALLGAPTRRGGAIAGAALAVLLTISLEGLPIAAAIGAAAALAWAGRPARGAMVRALGWTLAPLATALHLVTRGPLWAQPACDAMAPAWLATLWLAAAALTAATALGGRGLAVRLAGLSAAGALTAAALLVAAPDCLAGPFATLPPLVYRDWYLKVLEGRPLWEQPHTLVVAVLGLPVAGLIGGVLAWRRLPPRALTAAARERWAVYLLLLVASIAVAVAVGRATATANALAVPGAAVLLATMLRRARALRTAPARVVATLAALLLASPGQVAGVALILLPGAVERARLPGHRAPCNAASDVRALAALPPAIVFAPLDVTPELLVSTRHRAVAGGYHRGARAIEQVLLGFTLPPERARRAVAASGASYLAVCPGLPEAEQFRRTAPDGLWARLERGERIAWLTPLRVRGPVLAWRVERAPARVTAPLTPPAPLPAGVARH
ncbi:hypothetical protein [Sphingomonas sp. BK235]|uniref:hypothetical protein n=1 Tax=Sphingomonas sp. BK235 TaxID=2512131 RepID=UPI00104D3565|nr:hypothetical protein [Sphingomonas sp. BK235]TCP35709.1 hypothetical protein EV292_102297 [Sphingomonas sp. BK235]